MKICIVIYFIMTSCVFAQNYGKIIYKKTIKNEEYNDSKLIDINLKNTLKKANNYAEDLEFELTFNFLNAKFEKSKNLDEINQNDLDKKFALILIGDNGAFYYNLQNKIIINEIDNFGEKLLITNKIQENEWVLLDESKTVNDNTLFKAKLTKSFYKRTGKTTKEIIAWYNPSINIPFGPDGYFGLPGLIFELVDGNITTYLQSINFFDDEIEIQFPTKGKVMNDEEFYEYTNELFNKYRN